MSSRPPAEDTKAPSPAPRPYHTPELRSLGLVADVTEVNQLGMNPDSPYSTT